MGWEAEDILRQLAKDDTAQEMAAEAAQLIAEAVARDLAAGRDPTTQSPWPEKKSGGRPYANAAKSLSVKVFGVVVKLTISGPEAWGHFGFRGSPKRRMLPDAGNEIPQTIRDAIMRAMRRVMARRTGGAAQ